MAALFREAFDPARKLIVHRYFTCGGRDYAPGDTFDTTSVPVRRLRLLFNQRSLVMEGEEPRRITKPPAPLRFGRWKQTQDAHTAPQAAPQAAASAAVLPPIPSDWQSLPWFSLRAVVTKLIGTQPANKVEAFQLMTQELERRARAA